MTNVKWRPLNQKLSPADDLRWSAEKDLFLPTHGLDSTRSMNPHRRVGSFRPDRGYSGSARTRARRLRFSDPTFEESGFDIILIFYDHKLNIYPILEVMMAAYFSRLGLPTRRVFLREHDVVRVTHGDRNSPHLAECQLDGKFVS